MQSKAQGGRLYGLLTRVLKRMGADVEGKQRRIAEIRS